MTQISLDERVGIVMRALTRNMLRDLKDEAMSEEILLTQLPDEPMTLAHKLAEVGQLHHAPIESFTVKLMQAKAMMHGRELTVAQTAHQQGLLTDGPAQLRTILGKVGAVSVDNEFVLRRELRRQGIDVNEQARGVAIPGGLETLLGRELGEEWGRPGKNGPAL